MTWKIYNIWRRHPSTQWAKTARIVKARTDSKAQNKMRNMFKHAGFTEMQLVAVPEGETIT